MKPSTQVRIFWSIFLICMLEVLSWSVGMSSASQAPAAKTFFRQTTEHMSQLNLPQYSQDTFRESIEELIDQEEQSAAPSMLPSFLLLGASVTVALAGGLGFMSSTPSHVRPSMRSTLSSSSQSSISSGTDDDPEADSCSQGSATATLSGSSTFLQQQQEQRRQPLTTSPLLFAGAALSMAAARNPAALIGLGSRFASTAAVRSAGAAMTLTSRASFSTSAASMFVPPSPCPPSFSPATPTGSDAAQSSMGGATSSLFSAKQQQLLREVLRGADSDIVGSLRTGEIEPEHLHQTVADLLVEAVRPRTAPAAGSATSSQASHSPSSSSAAAAPLHKLSDKAILEKLRTGEVQQHQLEHAIGDLERAVFLRRKYFIQQGQFSQTAISSLPFENYDYQKVTGACCENVLGYVPIPVGLAGPVLINGEPCPLPMATTEGCLVASTHRGTKAINESGGAFAAILADGMTRAPVVRMPTAMEASKLKNWLDNKENYEKVVDSFNSTSRFARVSSIKATVAGCAVYLRFKAKTGDAMGMNMISKGVEKALGTLRESFPEMQILALSGNMCTDKKPSAINWIEGRGKSVVAEAIIKGDIVRKVLKTNVADLILLNQNKNLIGSAMAGSIGGFNAHAANIVTAMFLATGQDPAQNVESSNCVTLMEPRNDGQDLWISVTMPSIEVGTVGGGTHLPAQEACLKMMRVRGSHPETPGAHAQQLAMAVATGVLAGELSLMSALAEGSLVRSHLKLNRKQAH